MAKTNPYKNEIKILTEARKLLSKRNHWTKGTMARNADGRTTPPDSPDAASFCAVGAVEHVAVANNLGGLNRFRTVRAILYESLTSTAQSRYGSVEAYNDAKTRKHSHVLSLFDRTIARLRKAA